MVSAEKVEGLLDKTKTIIKHQREVKRLRGETFNVFSVLKMERKENATHSAFLAELLNPEGTHYRGNIFLRLFLETLGEPFDKFIDLNSAQVQPEFNIGKLDLDAKTGGRIDILIWDNSGNSISIENKIHAGDQEVQIERYCNYNKLRNKVFYLTLKGAEPSGFSKGELQCNSDFFIISYQKHIQEWLDKCIKESAEIPILRESIKQYKLLIQKLTFTMDRTHKEELVKVMLLNFEESQFIAANFINETNALRERVRKSIINKLNERFIDRFVASAGDPITNGIAQIWIKMKGYEKNHYYFGLESFSGNGGNFGGDLFVGIFKQKGDNQYGEPKDMYSDYWSFTHQLPEFRGYKMNLGHSKTLHMLYGEKELRNEFENYIIDEVASYLEQHAEPLKEFLIKMELPVESV